MTQRAAALVLLAAIGCASPEPAAGPAGLQDGRYAMGTLFEVTLHGDEEDVLARARDAVFAEATRLDGLWSRFDPMSDVSRLNAAGGETVRVEPVTVDLLRRALAYRERTRGSFDVTIGPLVSLWIDAAERDRLPGEAEIAAARARTGPDHVHLEAPDAVRVDAGSQVDLGAVAKGFALDRMREMLHGRGVRDALLSFGQSSVWAMGAPPGHAGWRLLARAPEGGFAGILTLRDQALSISGSLGQWSEIEGRRFGHVLDPRSGWPLTVRRQAVVVGPDGALAEMLSTALLVLGAAGMDLVAAEPGCEALLLEEGGPRLATSGFHAATAFEPLAPPREPAPQGRPPDVRIEGHDQGPQLSRLQRGLSALGRREGR